MQTFDCPSCGGPLEFKGGPDKFVRCPFCMNSVIVPKELRARTADLPHVNIQPSRGVPKALLIIIFVAAGLFILGIVIVVLPLRPKSIPPHAEIPAPQSVQVPLKPPPPKPEQPPGFATVVMTFGGEGIGPGLFTDARSIAVDGAGNIYVGEYGNGRIQVFDSDG